MKSIGIFVNYLLQIHVELLPGLEAASAWKFCLCIWVRHLHW